MKSEKRTTNPNVIVISPLKQLRRINGLWYALTLAPMPPIYLDRKGAIDVLVNRPIDWTVWQLYPDLEDIWRTGHYTVGRRQVSKRELARVRRLKA